MAVETEIKLRLPLGPAEVVPRIEKLGYRAGPRELEVDQVYDHSLDRLRATGRLLRVRSKGSTWTLTYKGPIASDRHKSREELEMDIADQPIFSQILERLGYFRSFRYEKYRTTYRATGANGIITVDETPIGSFLELEGDADWIDDTASLLGFTLNDYVTASYASLYAAFRQANPGVPEDMRF